MPVAMPTDRFINISTRHFLLGNAAHLVKKGEKAMIIGVATVRLYAPWVHSLKEKRMVAKSLMTRLQNKFNLSVAETDAQDTHQTLVLSMACVAATTALADSMLDAALAFIEQNTDAQITFILREFR